jgi:hypothetical protein
MQKKASDPAPLHWLGREFLCPQHGSNDRYFCDANFVNQGCPTMLAAVFGTKQTKMRDCRYVRS